MSRRYLIYVLVVILAIILGYSLALGSNNTAKEEEVASPAGVTDQSPVEQETEDALSQQIKAMTLEDKIGQLVIAGIDGYENDHNSQQLITKYHVGGFILLKQNIRDSKQMLALINSVKETNSANKIPLFLAIDEEGGTISRLPKEFTKIPTSAAIGQNNNNQLAYEMGSIIGEALKAFGLNMDFAPVLDINSNPNNPVIGDRAFGSKPEIVSRLGIQAMKGLQAQKVISVVKHFPGHGDTAVDSHVGLPTVGYDLKRLNGFELVPFAAAIKNNTDAIMIAHILLRKIDPQYPASLSKTIITDLLREKMKFEGIVITDDLTMGAIVNNYDIGEAAVTSFLAGSDLILVCHDYAKEEKVLKALEEAAQTGVIPLEQIERSVYKILKLKQKYDLADNTIKTINPQAINTKLEQLIDSFPTLK